MYLFNNYIVAARYNRISKKDVKSIKKDIDSFKACFSLYHQLFELLANDIKIIRLHTQLLVVGTNEEKEIREGCFNRRS